MSGKADIVTSLNSIGVTPTSDSYSDINNSIKSISPMKLGNVIYSNSRGDLLTSRTTSVTLNKGKYIVVADFVFAYADTATHNENSKTDSSFSTIQCSKCSIRQLDTEKIYISSSAIRGTMYPYAWTEQEMYYVEVLENNQVITQKQTWTTQFTSVGSFITLRAIKIAD